MTVEELKDRAGASDRNVSWCETGDRLIWCGANPDGSFTFRNTTEAFRRGPVISESEAAKYLADG